MTSGLVVPAGDNCAFCAYLRGTRPYTILWRTHVVAILVTREQRGTPHVLVAPVEHRPTLLDLTADEASAVMVGVVESARAIDASEERPGIAVWQNNGVGADQTIPHVHFHVAGTLPGGGTEWGDVDELSVAQTDQLAARLRPYLRIEALH